MRTWENFMLSMAALWDIFIKIRFSQIQTALQGTFIKKILTNLGCCLGPLYKKNFLADIGYSLGHFYNKTFTQIQANLWDTFIIFSDYKKKLSSQIYKRFSRNSETDSESKSSSVLINLDICIFFILYLHSSK